MIRTLLPLAAVLAIGACSEPAEQEPAPQRLADPPREAGTSEPVVALGLTARQLENADLLGPQGEDVGEVERIVTETTGQTRLVIEVEHSSPDRYVKIPVDGLTVVRRGDDIDLQGGRTRDVLMTLAASPTS